LWWVEWDLQWWVVGDLERDHVEWDVEWWLEWNQ
jgi:hypothetical protein